ncbi:MAG: hypothetical protein CMA02_00465 [Euryarchaeota archaeon]|nr:hypothetical protein [Euryarchaeota archaeon]
MSLPRQAMQQMGFSICCLLCDAPDKEGTKRCKSCISAHKKVRDRVSGEANGPLEQLAKDLMIFTTEPHRHDHDPVHGPFLKEAAKLMAAHAGQRPPPTEEEIAQAFEIARNTNKRNILREIRNTVPEKIDNVDSAIDLVDAIPARLDDHGVRTNPSRVIPKTDRSDRLGEDRELIDRFRAEEEARKKGEEVTEPVVERIIDERRARRDELLDLLSDVDQLIEDENE